MHSKTAIVAILAISFSTLTQSLRGQEVPDNSINRERAMTAIQFMNYLRYVSYEIADYNNVFVLEDEYRNLSADNLNLGRIPDEDVLQSIRDHLKTLYELRMEEKDRERFQAKLAKLAQRHRQDVIVNALKSAMTFSGEGATLLVGALAGATSGKMDAEAAVKLASEMAKEAFSVYDNYVDFQRQLEDSAEGYQYQFEDGKMKRLHEENLKNLDFARRLVVKYGIADELRLTEADAKALIECVKAKNKTGAFNQLKVMAKNQPSFTYFPAFWSYYAAFASLTGHPDEALSAARHFEEIWQYSLFRRHRLAAQTAMAKIQSMVEKGMTTGDDAEQIREALKTIVRYNYDSHDYDMAYFCAAIAHDVIGDDTNALDVLNGLIAGQERKASADLIQYSYLFAKADNEHPFEKVPMMADLIRCLALRATIEKGNGDDTLRASLVSIFENTIARGIEHLFWIGDLRVTDLLSKAEPEIEAISLRYASGVAGLKSDKIIVRIPATWFVLGDFPIDLTLKNGTNIVESMTDIYERRKIVFNRPASAKAFVEIAFARNSTWDSSDDFDTCELKIPHPSWPISIIWLPKANGEDFGIAAVEFSGIRHAMPSYEKSKNTLLEKLTLQARSKTSGNNRFAMAIAFPDGQCDLAENGLIRLEGKSDSVTAYFDNQGILDGKTRVNASFFNGFGKLLGTAEGETKVSSGLPYEVCLRFPEKITNARRPDFMLLSCEKTGSPRKLASSYPEFAFIATNSVAIPGLSEGFTPQGLTYLPKRNWFLFSGYYSNAASAIIAVEAGSGNVVKQIRLKNPDGTAYTNHAGGIATTATTIVVSSNKKLHCLPLTDFLKGTNGQALAFSREISMGEHRASYCSCDGETFWVGEFRQEPKYKTDKSHRMVLKDDTFQSWLCGYGLKNGELPLNAREELSPPDYVLVTPDKTQGASVSDGTIWLSVSYGRKNDSVLLAFDSPFETNPDTCFKIGGTDVPAWFLGKGRRVRSVTAPPMTEDLCRVGNDVFVVFESGAKEFRHDGKCPVGHLYRFPSKPQSSAKELSK